MEVLYHDLTRDTPILFGTSEEIDEFITKIGLDKNITYVANTSDNDHLYFFIVTIGETLKYIIINTDLTRTLFGEPRPEDILTATFAIYAAQEYENIVTQKELLLKAMELVVKLDKLGAYRILKSKYVTSNFGGNPDAHFEFDSESEDDIEDIVFGSGNINEQNINAD